MARHRALRLGRRRPRLPGTRRVTSTGRTTVGRRARHGDHGASPRITRAGGEGLPQAPAEAWPAAEEPEQPRRG
eukprot:812041-Heterocapsa_arctica.AAC.1